MRRQVTIAHWAHIIGNAAPQIKRVGVLAMRQVAQQLVAKVVNEIVVRGLPDTQALQKSVRWRATDGGGTVIVDAPHAPYIEYGTRPHRPPLQPLVEWAMRKLGVTLTEARSIAWVIAEKQALYGTPPHRFFASAMSGSREMARAAVTKSLKTKLRLR